MQNMKDFIVSFLDVHKLYVFKDIRLLTINEIIVFTGLSIIQWAYKTHKADLSELYDSKQVPHFRATISRDRYQLFIKFCHFDEIKTQNARKMTNLLQFGNFEIYL